MLQNRAQGPVGGHELAAHGGRGDQRRVDVDPADVRVESAQDAGFRRRPRGAQARRGERGDEGVEAHLQGADVVRQGGIGRGDDRGGAQRRRRSPAGLAVTADHRVDDGEVRRRGRRQVGHHLARVPAIAVVVVLVGERQHAEQGRQAQGVAVVLVRAVGGHHDPQVRLQPGPRQGRPTQRAPFREHPLLKVFRQVDDVIGPPRRRLVAVAEQVGGDEDVAVLEPKGGGGARGADRRLGHTEVEQHVQQMLDQPRLGGCGRVRREGVHGRHDDGGARALRGQGLRDAPGRRRMEPGELQRAVE